MISLNKFLFWESVADLFTIIGRPQMTEEEEEEEEEEAEEEEEEEEEEEKGVHGLSA